MYTHSGKHIPRYNASAGTDITLSSAPVGSAACLHIWTNDVYTGKHLPRSNASAGTDKTLLSALLDQWRVYISGPMMYTHSGKHLPRSNASAATDMTLLSAPVGSAANLHVWTNDVYYTTNRSYRRQHFMKTLLGLVHFYFR